MARIHGRHGRIYLGATAGGEASPVGGTTDWTLNAQTDMTDCTAQGDLSKQSQAGLPGSDFSFNSFYDDSEYTGNVFKAAAEGTARKIYMYPDARTGSKYWFGTAFVSGNISSSVSDMNKLSGQGAFATDCIGVGV